MKCSIINSHEFWKFRTQKAIGYLYSYSFDILLRAFLSLEGVSKLGNALFGKAYWSNPKGANRVRSFPGTVSTPNFITNYGTLGPPFVGNEAGVVPRPE